jgi:hypothetical protein
MGEKLQRLPPWAKKLLLVLSIVGPACGAITTVTVTIMDIRAKARSLDQKTEASYETLAPAVNELKEIQNKAVVWAQETDEGIKKLRRKVIDQEKRIIRLETYIEILSKERRLPEPPPKPTPTVAAGVTKVMVEDDAPEAKPGYLEQKSQRVVPSDIAGAKKLKKVRDKEGCPPSDPLCGTGAL